MLSVEEWWPYRQHCSLSHLLGKCIWQFLGCGLHISHQFCCVMFWLYHRMFLEIKCKKSCDFCLLWRTTPHWTSMNLLQPHYKIPNHATTHPPILYNMPTHATPHLPMLHHTYPCYTTPTHATPHLPMLDHTYTCYTTHATLHLTMLHYTYTCYTTPNHTTPHLPMLHYMLHHTYTCYTTPTHATPHLPMLYHT